jgi:hypothetical protein
MLNMLLNTTMATKILEQKVSTLETDNAFYKQQIRLLQQKREEKEEQKLDENVKNGEYYGRVFVSKIIVDMCDRLYVKAVDV